MDLLFLGTSSGTPTKTRNVTALALIEDQGSGWCLIDCGEGTQHRLLQSPLSVRDLLAIFITHVHGDHCYGLPGLLASAGMGGRTAPLKIVAPEGIEEWFRATQLHTQLHLPFEIVFERAEPLQGLRLGQWTVDAIELSHRVPSFAYSFTEAHVDPALDTDRLQREGVPRGPLWGRLKKGEDVEHAGKTLHHADYLTRPYPARKIIIGGDNDTPALLTAASRGCQVLVHEATHTAEVAAKVGPVGHSSAELVARFAQAVGLPNLVLTHFSARYQADAGTDQAVDKRASIEDIRTEAAGVYQGRLFLAEDFARYKLNRAGELNRVA